MTSDNRVRTPRIEVSEILPLVPADHFGPDEAGMVDAALRRLAGDQEQGEGPDAAVCALLGRSNEDMHVFADRAQAAVAADAQGASQALYAFAAAADAAGREDDAKRALALLSASQGGRLPGLLGLSVIALRHGLVAEAAALVAPCMEAQARHPRAVSVAGICELEQGRAAAAQSHLAAASRLARRRPEFRTELQVAQKALLRMHFG